MSDVITLTEGQQSAYEAFVKFITQPSEGVFVIEGFSGTGKSTLIETVMDNLDNVLKTAKLLVPKTYIHRDVVLTATTNQAADQFSRITGEEVKTIQSVLQLRVHKDFKTDKTKLVPRRGATPVENCIIFVDEASYLDKDLMQQLFKYTINCKIILIGDPAQLLSVGSTYAPAFNSNFPTAKLTEVVRQAEGNPIVDLSTAFRETVNTGEFFSFQPDGHHIQHLNRDAFENEIIKEFDDSTWNHFRSKVLAWTNKTVINYNKAIREHVKGTPDLHVGDFAVCNRYLNINNTLKYKTDQLVTITLIKTASLSESFDVPGKWYELDNRAKVFMPDDWQDAKKRLKQARAENDWGVVQMIDDEWADLRAAYACTINKSQGCTYDRVFIDLDDVSKCNSGNQIARMLYVAVSRARERVYLTGDLV